MIEEEKVFNRTEADNFFFSVKGHIVNILGFVGYLVSVTTRFRGSSMNTAMIESAWRNEYMYNSPYKNQREEDRIWPFHQSLLTLQWEPRSLTYSLFSRTLQI